MKLLHALASHYGQHRFAALFAILLVAIAGHGLVALVTPIANPMEWILGIALLAVVFSGRRGMHRWLLGGLAVIGVAARLANDMLDPPVAPLLGEVLVAVVCLLGSGVAARRAFASGPVDAERICAALDAYLLMGIAFGAGYWLMETALPGSFSSGPFTPPRAVYFSLVTQTTLGFGDIVPIGEHAQGVVVTQGICGQIYLVVLVARLVTLYVEERNP
jgi:hypothetical protein